MATLEDRIYFGAADRQTEALHGFTSREARFERAIVDLLLFQQRVVIPDVFHFISEPLFEHVMAHRGRESLSLLEAALAAGVVTPAFRDRRVTTYREMNAVLTETGVIGLLPRDSRQLLAEHLDRAAASTESPPFTPDYWPDHSVGDRFGSRIAGFLQREDPPLSLPGIEDVWRRTEKLRGAPLDRARERGAEVGGFRRGDYMNEIGAYLGARETIHDMAELLQLPPSYEDRTAVRVLCTWINDCYQYNQAIELSALPVFSEYSDPWSLASLASLAALASSDGATEVSTTSESRDVVCRMPPPSVLAQLDGRTLMKIRSKKTAREYFAAIENWCTGTGNFEIVEDALRAYASELTRVAASESKYNESFLRLRLGHLSGPTRGVVVAAAAAINACYHGDVAKGAGIIAVASCGWATYQWLRERTENRTITLVRPRIVIR